MEFRERNKSFAEVGAYRAGAVNLGTTDQPRRVNSAIVTSELMPVLGVPAIRGRQFTREDTLPGAEDVAILSLEIWQTAFASDDSAIGRVLRLDGVPTRIVGIMPAGYDIHDAKVQVWLPLTLDPANPGNRGGHFLYLVGRLRDHVSMVQARADVERMLVQWNDLNPKMHTPDPKNHRLRLDGLRDDLVGGIATALWVLQGAVGFVLLIACANLANLLLARAESRQKEFAIRSALGAGRIRLLRQFMTEGVVLALIGGAVGVAVGFAGLRTMLAANPESLPRAASVALDPAVLLFTLLISLLTGMLFGMAPLLHMRERAVTLSLKEAGQRSTAGAARARLRAGLVMGEIALAVVLVVGAGLLLRSFWNLMKVDAGFNRSRLATFGLVLPPASYQQPQSRIDFTRRLIDQLRQGRLTNFAPSNMNVVIRTALPTETLATSIRQIVGMMDPTLPVVRLRTMDDVFSESVSRPRFLAQLLGLFAGLALLLAAIGTYGILSYTVSERRKEIGIHMALGATRHTVLGMVLGQGARLTAAGLVIGFAASLLLTRFLQTQLFNVKPADPVTIAVVMAFIALVAAMACYIPASRATRVDPMVVLRDE